MGGEPFEIVTNMQTHMVVEADTGRCLGAIGATYYRPWVFPLYTPSGLTVVREYPFDHPFHNGVFVGQHPVIVGGREANIWAVPPRRSHDDHIFTKVGRMDVQDPPEMAAHETGARLVFQSVWRDENEEPMIDERRTVNLFCVEDATVCDVTSEKTSSYGNAEYPQTKFGSIGVRVEPRLLPPLGGVIMGDGGRSGNADVVQEQPSDLVAYENELAGSGRFGVLLCTLPQDARGPWFIRDYGMAMYNPTWTQSISVREGGLWTVGLRVVAYDGALTDERIRTWLSL